MKKLINLSYLIMLVALLAVSCSDDDGGSTEPQYSPLSVEENKTNIEKDGEIMFNEVKQLESEPAVDVAVSFVDLLDKASILDEKKSSDLSQTIAFAPIYAVANIEKSGVNGTLKTLEVNTAEEPESIQEAYNELKGTYSWNASNNDWDYTSGADAIIILFPSTENGTSNDASYTVTYVGYDGPNPIKEDGDYMGDIPQSVTTTLKVGDAVYLAYNLGVDYDSDGIPTNIESSLSIGSYKMAMSVSNSGNTKFISDLSFTHDSKVLVKAHMDASGNWSQENIDASKEYYVEVFDSINYEWSYIKVSENDDWDYYETDPHEIFKNGNAYVQLLNTKVVGSIDFEKLYPKIESIDEQYDSYDENGYDEAADKAWAEAVATAMNDYSNLSLRYANTDELIAVAEFYAYQYDDEWDDYSYWDVNIRFVFADGSKTDVETYFNTGFDDLVNDVASYLEELEDTYDL